MSRWKGRKNNTVHELALRGICDKIMNLTNFGKPITAPAGFANMKAQWDLV